MTCVSRPHGFCKLGRSWASRAPISFPPLQAMPKLQISAARDQNFYLHSKPAQTRWVGASPGIWTSGASTASQRRRPAPTWWRANGARREVITALIANLAAGYFQLRALDLQLEISQRTLASRRDSLRLTSLLAQGGSTSMLDVRQAEQLVFTAASEVPSLEQQIEQEENSISTLIGTHPAAVPRGRKLTEQEHPPTVPAGLPSSLLEKRPDIRQAEEQLVSANAQIGVARAAYFPQISLTAASGYQSSALTSLFSGPAGLWNFGGALTQPIFTAGKLRSNVRLTQARQQEFLLRYQQTIQGAFGTFLIRWWRIAKPRSFASSKNSWLLPRRTHRASRTCGTAVVLLAILRSSPTKPTISPPNSPWHKLSSTNYCPSYRSIGPWAEDGSNEFISYLGTRPGMKVDSPAIWGLRSIAPPIKAGVWSGCVSARTADVKEWIHIY